MISAAVVYSFIDEMEHIAGKQKEAAFLSNVGNRIIQTGKWLGGHARQAGADTGATLQKMFTSPLKSSAEGVRWMVSDASNAGLGGKALALGGLGLQGMQTVQDIKDIKSKVDPTGRGRGRGQRIGESIGSTMGGLIGTPHNLVGGIVGGEVGRRGLGFVGKGVDKAIAAVKNKRAPVAAAPTLTDSNARPIARLVGSGAKVLE